MQLLVVAGFLAVLERNMRKGLALHAERKPFGYLSVTPACAGLGSLVDDLVESVVLHDVSFRSAWRRSCFLFFPLAAAVSLVCCFSAGGVAVSPRVGCGSGFLSGPCRIVSLCSVVPSL